MDAGDGRVGPSPDSCTAATSAEAFPPFSFGCLYLRTKVLILSSRMGSSVPSRSCPPRTPRGAWPASSRWHWRGRRGGRRAARRSSVRRVARRVAARAVFDEHALYALAGNVRQLVLVDEGHLGVLR